MHVPVESGHAPGRPRPHARARSGCARKKREHTIRRAFRGRRRELPPDLVMSPSEERALSRLDRDLKLLAVAILLFALAIGMGLRLLSTYASDLGASGFAIGVLNGVMLAIVAPCSAPRAWAARRYRLKPVIVGVWRLAALAPASFFLAPSWPWLMPGHVVSGLSFADNPAMTSSLNLKSEPTHAAGNVAMLYGVLPLGLTAAPLVGGCVADH